MPNSTPQHPGIMLADLISRSGKQKVEIARLSGISRQHIHDIVRCEKPISAQVAVRLGKLFGNGGATWLREQASYDAHNADIELVQSGRHIPTLGTA